MATDIDAALPRFLDYYHEYVHMRMIPKSPWEALFPRAKWDWKKGATQSVYTYEPSVSGAMATISALTVPAGAGSGVGTATFTPDVTVSGSNTARTTQLEEYKADTEYINIDDLHRDFFGGGKHIQNLLQNLAIENADWLANWKRNRSFDYVDTLRAANANGAIESVASSAVTSEATLNTLIDTLTEANVEVLSDKHLKRLYIELEYGDADFYGMLNGRGAYSLVGSYQAISHLFKEDITEELKYADPQSNLTRFGIDRGANGFIPVYDAKAYRFADTTMNWIPPTVNVATTKGNKSVVNPAWLDAEFELVWLMGKNFATCETEPTGPKEFFGGASFDTVRDHMGEPKWISGQDTVTDPEGRTGRFISRVRVAFRPEQPQAAMPLLVKIPS